MCERVTGDGDGDISRQGEAFCYDFLACEPYVKAVGPFIFCSFSFFFVVNFIAYF